MSETKDKADNTEKKTLSLSGKTLSLKGGVGAKPPAPARGVAVEVRRSRRSTSRHDSASPNENKNADDLNLTDSEREARARALKTAMEAGESRTSSLPRHQGLQIKETVRDKEGIVTPDKPLKGTAEEKAQPDISEIQARLERAGPVIKTTHGGHKHEDSEDEDSLSVRDKLKKSAVKKQTTRSTMDRRGGRLTVNQALNSDFERDRGPSLAAQRRAREKARMNAHPFQEPTQKAVREVIVPEFITVQELSNRMAEPGGEVVKALMKMGVMATITQTIDADTAELLISEFGHKIKRVTDADVEIGLLGADDAGADLLPRPPVVTIMGHVDHGKTSLLDALRSTNVVSGEAGGITQHIGAYQVTMESGDKITFLDTPGHEAFTEMRARGANVTDIVVIVVAANDSVMPQTIEAINHAKAAKVPIIIAVNKIDLPDARPNKVKQDLLQHEIVIEDLGGDVQCIEVSAKQKMNLNKLEEAILLQAEMLELKANPNREAHGFVVESKMEKGRGPVATVLIQKGTIKIGDIFIAGAETGRVRALIDDQGKPVERAIPGQPVEVLGSNGVPNAGDTFDVVEDEAKAKEISDYRKRKNKDAAAAKAVSGRTTMEQLLAQRDEGKKKSLPVIIRADVNGSIEAIAGSLQKMVDENEGIEVQVLHTGVGGITESDVILARASGALIIGFNVRANIQARDLAQREGVDMRYYNIIYNVIDDAKAMLTGMLDPVIREEYLGQAKIKQVFNITKVGKVAGCEVTEGQVKRGSKVRLLRDDVVIHEGMLKTLQRFKDEVKEVKEGTECGMAFENYDDIKEGDIIECYELIEEIRTIS